MREILFRGKSVTDGRWVFGDLSNYGDYRAITTTRGFSIIDSCEVIPETVGQYTGLKDLHGTRIFESDVCKAYICKAADTVEKEVVGVICFEDGTFEFKCEHENIYLYPLIDVLEVIGNVYDNQELLEEDKT